MTDPRTFYTETLPAQWNAALRAQEALGAAGRPLYEEMAAVDATIRVDVEGPGGGCFFLNIEAGRMTPGEGPARAPFLTLVQGDADFRRLAAEAGDSALGMLGALSGLAGEMRLTRTRIENLRSLRGTIGFEVTGEGGFALHTHFGEGPAASSPQARIRIAVDVYRRLRAGSLDAPQAFLEGGIQVEGDVQLTLQLALAAIAPD
jgi:hypothetical protein